MITEGTSLLGWSNQELLARLGGVSPEEWVCHIATRTNEEGGTFLESSFATLLEHENAVWKITVSRDRYDAECTSEIGEKVQESFWINTQRLHPPAAPFLVMDGPLARRQFFLLRDSTRPVLVEEAMQSELAFADPQEPPTAPSAEQLTFSVLLEAIDSHPRARWRIRFIQRGGVFDYCEHEISTQIDAMQIAIGRNLLSKVDEITASESGLPEYHLELRNAEGASIPHSLSGLEIRQLYAAFRERVARTKPKPNLQA